MQSTLFEPQTLPELPSVSMLDRWVFESPLPLILICFAIAIIIFGSLRHTKHAKRIAYPSLAIGCLLGISIYIASQLVTTNTSPPTSFKGRFILPSASSKTLSPETLSTM